VSRRTAACSALAALAFAGCHPAGGAAASEGERAAAPAAAGDFAYAGALTQGGFVRGTAPPGAQALRFNGEPLALAADGSYFAAFDRDSGPSALLEATLASGEVVSRPLAVSPRGWNIEHVDVARRAGGASESFMRRRRPELERIAAARAVGAQSEGWRQNFIWPVRGRISGRFGSQRIYRGEPGSYHSGIDIATGGSGATFVAPADGVVTLAAADSPFSLEGHLLIIDHGNGLNSAFLHCSALLVKEGERVAQGQPLGKIGMSGRATGPHLHWSLKWHDARLDPLLFTGPM